MKITGLIFVLIAALILSGAFAAEEKTFQVNPGGSLNVNIETGGSIDIKGSEGTQATVKWEITGRDADNVRVSVDSTGGRVQVSSVYVERRRQSGSSVNFWITIPSRFDLDVRTMGGNLSIANIEGTIAGKTMGGSLALKGLKGDLKISTMGGNISLVDSDVDGKASTMGGNIIVRNVAGNADVSTMGGNIVLDNVIQRGAYSINKMVNISTMGGSIEVANAPQGAKVETKGGNIVIKKSAAFIDLKTMGGNIAVHEHNGRLNAHTMGGNVSAFITPGEGDQSIDISSKGGKIDLTLPSTYSGQFDLTLDCRRRDSNDCKIISDFPIRQEDVREPGPSDARKEIRGTGTVNGGKNTVKVRTTEGDIVIRKK